MPSRLFFPLALLLAGCSKQAAPLRALPDFSLTGVTVDGTSPFDRRAMLGRVWVADFIFTRCVGPCPMLSANMQALQSKLPKSVGLVSFSVDPDHDSPEVLSVYARKFSADPQRWFFVTGDKAALLRLFREGFLVAYDQDAAGNISHATNFVLVDAQARVVRYYDGLDSSALERLAADAKRL